MLEGVETVSTDFGSAANAGPPNSETLQNAASAI